MIFDWPDDKPIHEAIGEALGAASMCWDPTPTGEFDPTRCYMIADELVDLIQRKLLGDPT